MDPSRLYGQKVNWIIPYIHYLLVDAASIRTPVEAFMIHRGPNGFDEAPGVEVNLYSLFFPRGGPED